MVWLLADIRTCGPAGCIVSVLYTAVQHRQARNAEPTARSRQAEQKPHLHSAGRTAVQKQHVIQQCVPTVTALVYKFIVFMQPKSS